MKYICAYSETCYARGYCFHARAHEKLPVKSNLHILLKCTDEYLCSSTESHVKCVEYKESEKRTPSK